MIKSMNGTSLMRAEPREKWDNHCLATPTTARLVSIFHAMATASSREAHAATTGRAAAAEYRIRCYGYCQVNMDNAG